MTILVCAAKSELTVFVFSLLLFMSGGLGDWSASGCQVAAIDDEQSTVHCQCTHLTNFAILLVRP